MLRLSMVIRAWLGSMFIYSAGLKLAHYDRAGFRVTAYDVLPRSMATAAGFALPWAELLTATSLLIGRLYPLGPLLGASLGSSFAYGSFRVLRRKADVPCGCDGGTRDRVDRATLARALAITSSSLLVLGVGKHNHASIPTKAVTAVSLGSLLPAGMTLYQRRRHAQLRRQHQRYIHSMVVQATQLLDTPLSEIGVNQLE